MNDANFGQESFSEGDIWLDLALAVLEARKFVKILILLLGGHVLPPLFDVDDDQLDSLQSLCKELMLHSLQTEPLVCARVDLVLTFKKDDLIHIQKAEVYAEGFAHLGVLLESSSQLQELLSLTNH